MTIPTFPTLIGLNFPVKYSPTWRTIIQEATSGKDTRLQLFSYPRYKYTIGVSYLGALANFKANADWSTLVGFFNRLNGATLPFHWNNPYDTSVTDQQLGTGDGSNKTFNFIRSLGGFLEPVQDVTTITNVKINGTPTSAYTTLTDPNYGLTYGIQFTAAPALGATVTSTFTYNWCVNFDKDTADFENFAYTYWNLKQITFTTKKVI